LGGSIIEHIRYALSPEKEEPYEFASQTMGGICSAIAYRLQYGESAGTDTATTIS
jgi:hypothetical protein